MTTESYHLPVDPDQQLDASVSPAASPEFTPEFNAWIAGLDQPRPIRMGSLFSHVNPELGIMTATEGLYVTPLHIEGYAFGNPGVDVVANFRRDPKMAGVNGAKRVVYAKDGSVSLVGEGASVGYDQYELEPGGRDLPIDVFKQVIKATYEKGLLRVRPNAPGDVIDNQRLQGLVSARDRLRDIQEQFVVDKVAHHEQLTPGEQAVYDIRNQAIFDVVTGRSKRGDDRRREEAFVEELCNGVDSHEKIGAFEQQILAALDSADIIPIAR